MADTAKCFSLVRGRVMRVTALDKCGRVKVGACSAIVSEGFVSVAFTANTDAGTAISVTNAAGKICVQDTPCPVFTGYNVEIQFCEVNPELLAMLTGQQALYDLQSGLGNGFTINSDISACDSGFAIELWSNVPGQPCAVGAAGSYGYVLVPFLQGGVFGDFTIQNDSVTFIVTGAVTKKGSGWDVGPYNVVSDVSGQPAKLATPIKSGDHLLVQMTSVAPPSAACACVANGVPATGATQGKPAVLAPANSYPPKNLADLIAGKPAVVVATPTTAWTTGNYIVLGDGSSAHWSGTAWVAGVA